MNSRIACNGFVCRLVLMILLIVCLTMPAAADLSRGSKGEDVRHLQCMLIDLGFLDDKADGIFGKKTQAAVKSIQRYWCVEETGIADEGLINDLELLWALAMGIERESGAPIDAESYPPFCCYVEDGEGILKYCWRHIDQYPVQLALSAWNPPQKLEYLLMHRICEFWYLDICRMYRAWEEMLAESEKDIAQEQLERFEEELDANRAAWNEQYGEASADAMTNEMIWLENRGVLLCAEIYEAGYGPYAGGITGNWYADVDGEMATLILYADNSYVLELSNDVQSGRWTLQDDTLSLDTETEDEFVFAYDANHQTLHMTEGTVFSRTIMMGWSPPAVRGEADLSDFQGVWYAHHVNYFGPLMPCDDADVYMDAFISGPHVSVILNDVNLLTYEGEAELAGNVLTLVAPPTEESGMDETFKVYVLEDGSLTVETVLHGGPATFYLEEVLLLE